MHGVAGFIPGGEAVDGANGGSGGLGRLLQIFLGEIAQTPLVDAGVGGGVEEEARRIALREQLQTECGPGIGFTGEDEDHVSLLRMVGDEPVGTAEGDVKNYQGNEDQEPG